MNIPNTFLMENYILYRMIHSKDDVCGKIKALSTCLVKFFNTAKIQNVWCEESYVVQILF